MRDGPPSSAAAGCPWPRPAVRRLISLKHHFLSSTLSGSAPPILAVEQRWLFISKQATLQSALRGIRLTPSPMPLRSRAPEGHSCLCSRVSRRRIPHFHISFFCSDWLAGRATPRPRRGNEMNHSPRPVVLSCLLSLKPSRPLPLLLCHRQVLCIQGRARQRRTGHRDD